MSKTLVEMVSLTPYGTSGTLKETRSSRYSSSSLRFRRSTKWRRRWSFRVWRWSMSPWCLDTGKGCHTREYLTLLDAIMAGLFRVLSVIEWGSQEFWGTLLGLCWSVTSVYEEAREAMTRRFFFYSRFSEIDFIFMALSYSSLFFRTQEELIRNISNFNLNSCANLMRSLLFAVCWSTWSPRMTSLT